MFFGRSALTDDLVARLDSGDRFIAVIGASGSGKSSVVRAGILPVIRRGDIENSEQWFVTTMTPGAHPFESLESALLRVAVNQPPGLLDLLASGDRGILRGVRRATGDTNETVLLVIDQFEELFTLCDDNDQRQLFLDGLCAACLLYTSDAADE